MIILYSSDQLALKASLTEFNMLEKAVHEIHLAKSDIILSELIFLAKKNSKTFSDVTSQLTGTMLARHAYMEHWHYVEPWKNNLGLLVTGTVRNHLSVFH